MKKLINLFATKTFYGELLFDGEIKLIPISARFFWQAKKIIKNAQGNINCFWATGEYGHFDRRPRYIGVFK